MGPTPPPIHWLPLAFFFFRGQEASPLTSSSSQVGNEWNSTSTPHTRFHGVVLERQGQLYVFSGNMMVVSERVLLHPSVVAAVVAVLVI